jgi:hypothetical protein
MENPRLLSIFCVGILGAASPGWAVNPILMFGRAGDLAVDQLRVTFALEDPANPGEIVGPHFYDTGLLDTGANGVLLGQLAYIDDQTFEVNPNLYDVASTPTNPHVIYNESGVAGSEPFDVTIAYNLYVAGDDGIPIQQTGVHALGSSDIALPIGGVIGMPAMTGRVITADFSGLPNLNNFIVVDFESAPPTPTPGVTYDILMPMLEPEYPGQEQPTDPKPTFHDLPLMSGLKFNHGSNHTTQTLLLDTGAQNSIISRDAAIALGIDPDDPNHETIEVGGIGGSVDMPLVLIDEMVVPTSAGVDLVFTDVVVGILDITGIDGVIGMNWQTTGYFDLLFEADPGEYGAFMNMVLDFRDPNTGVMRLEVNPDYIKSPGDTDMDGDIDLNDLATLASNYGLAANSYWDMGDFDRDGDVDLSDLSALAANYGSGEAQAFADFQSLTGVPEPSTLAIFGLGLLGIASRGRRRD